VHLTQANNTRTFVVKELPEKAGIHPFHVLVDRTKDDNVKNVDLR
jgi:hypothetical protein